MSNFIKNVLVELGELDRMQQRQLKNYFHELSALARLRTQMAKTLSRKNLSNDQKLLLIYFYQCRFDKLQRDTCVITSGPLMPLGPAPQLYKPANNVENKALYGKSAKQCLNKRRREIMNLIKNTTGNTLTPALKIIRDMSIKPIYERKARNLWPKFSTTPTFSKGTLTGCCCK